MSENGRDRENSVLKGAAVQGASVGATGTSVTDLASLVEAKRAEFKTAGVWPTWRYRWPLGGFPVDDQTRTSQHGDPLLDAIAAQTPWNKTSAAPLHRDGA